MRVPSVMVMVLLAGVLGCGCSEDTTPVDAGTDALVGDLAGSDGPGRDGPTVDVPLDDAQPDVDDDGPATDVEVTPDGPAPPGTWIAVPPSRTPLPATFTMGSPTSEACRSSDEDQHQVTLTRSFEIQNTEVTQAQFQSLMSYNPSNFSSCGNNCPVETVNWHEAVAYCNALSDTKGYTKCYSCTGSGTSVTCQQASAYTGQNIYNCPGYRLPTEAEWEYAYRAGTTTAFYNGSITSCTGTDSNADAIGWYSANSGSTTHPVAQKQPNAWGLYDMAGNVWEWCNDWYQSSLGTSALNNPWGASSGGNRVLRGGSWAGPALDVRAAGRLNYNPADRGYYSFGFRCSRTK